jgi:hypothetical protein
MKPDTQEPISGCPTQCADFPGSLLQRHEAVDPETNNERHENRCNRVIKQRTETAAEEN